VKKLHWQMHDRSLPRHPYRDSAIVYGSLGALVVLIAVATGGSVVKALIYGGAAFLGATSYSWWRLREKLRKQDGREE
jgi:predicted tellurium resistance membrane protein TerC